MRQIAAGRATTARDGGAHDGRPHHLGAGHGERHGGVRVPTLIDDHAGSSVVLPPAYPHPIELPPAPAGDPAAARRLAAAYRRLADDSQAAHDQARRVVGGLTTHWHGTGVTTVTLPTTVLDHNTAALTTALHQVADHLQSYADTLEHAQHHHRWSLGKLLVIGAVVVVTAAAITVTVGAAAPVGTLAAVEVAEALAAAGTATETAAAAEAAAAGGLSELTGTALTALRAFTADALPHLVQGGIGAGLDTAGQLLFTHHLDVHEVVETFLTTAAFSAGTGTALSTLRGTARYAAATRTGQLAAETTTVAGVSTGIDAARQYADTGTVHLDQAARTGLETGLLTALGSTVTDLRTGGVMGIAEAPPPMQTGEDLLTNGANLLRHEGVRKYGHTIRKHCGKTVAWLQGRLEAEPHHDMVSTFPDVASAEAAIDQALRLNAAGVRHFERTAAVGDSYTVKQTLDRDLGKILYRTGKYTSGRTVLVLLRRQRRGLLIVTAYVKP